MTLLVLYVTGMSYGGMILTSGLLNGTWGYMVIGTVLLATVHQIYRYLGLYRILHDAVDENDIP